jgi:hypothetical protein
VGGRRGLLRAGTVNICLDVIFSPPSLWQRILRFVWDLVFENEAGGGVEAVSVGKLCAKSRTTPDE